MPAAITILVLAGSTALAATEVAGDGALENALLARVNAVRDEQRLLPLEPRDDLARLAREFSCRMAREGFFDHRSPTGETLGDRARQAGTAYTLIGENIAKLSGHADPAAAAVRNWLESAGHRANILNARFTQTGVGVCRRDRDVLITQVFARPP